jgi:hypothetical protein
MRYGLFEPDVLLTEVWGAAQARSGPLSSEKRLMLAVLHDAFDCYQKYLFAEDRLGRELFEEAAAWINCTGSQGLFSFESISETLDIEPEYFRRGLAEWHRLQVKARGAEPCDGRSPKSVGDPSPDPELLVTVPQP